MAKISAQKNAQMNQEIQSLLNKVKKLEKNEQLDLSSDEDLSIGVMNLISIEEHLFFTANKTGKSEYYDILVEIREMRKSLLKMMIKDYEGEVWCISKHLLAGSMRLMEVGTKFLGKGDKKQAIGLFTKSYQLYSLFWGLNLGIVNSGSAEKSARAEGSEGDTLEYVSETEPPLARNGGSMFDKLGQVVKKAIDCCRE